MLKSEYRDENEMACILYVSHSHSSYSYVQQCISTDLRHLPKIFEQAISAILGTTASPAEKSHIADFQRYFRKTTLSRNCLNYIGKKISLHEDWMSSSHQLYVPLIKFA